MRGNELTEEQWRRIQPLLPRHGRRGRPRADDCRVLHGTCTSCGRGCRWEKTCRGSTGAYVTAWRRLRQWQQEGVWERIWQGVLASLDEEGKLDWARAFLDGSFVPAKGGEEVGLTKVGKGTKRMLTTDGEGMPLAFLLAGANHAEAKLAEATLDRIRVPRKRGRPRKRPERLVTDRAYDCDALRRWLRGHGVRPCIPPRRNRKGRRKAWGEEYRERWHVERTFAWMGTYRRLLVRHERLLVVYAGFFTLACIMICLGRLLK